MTWIDSRHRKISTGLHFQNGCHNTTKIQHCSISKVAFDLFFKPVVSGRFGRLHNRKEAAWVCRNMSLWYFIAKKNSHSLILKWKIYDHSSVTHIYIGWFMVFNATFNNISVTSWRSVLLVEEQGRIQRLCWQRAQLWSNILALSPEKVQLFTS
jgi:hypothetical protein